ncbi:hypothetical protein F8E02_10775 [Methanoculleus sp. Wushi-C6]|uniref:DUF1616 domain-containing protein n=1 Tax=Methanoculleus caldifontis TaxID=2651577 RepID=A0ABU3X333_9EURY|nr:hypothetical protein [Methanoculleus sp. Wushi-C6]MDV2482475.1 hypothetical protein [Methanoculleus sp. Wushi-C6]
MGSSHRTGADFLLINLLLLVLTQPGALVLAGFDPPFGLAVSATTWMAAFVGVSPLAVLYILIKSESLGRRFLPAAAAYIVLILAVAYASYLMQQPLFEGFRAPGYEQSFPIFLAASVLTAVISLTLLPVGLLAYAGDPENLPLLAVNLALLAAAVLLWRLRSRGEGPYREP